MDGRIWIGDDGVRMFTDALKGYVTLRELDLNKNYIERGLVWVFAFVIRDSSSLICTSQSPLKDNQCD